MGRLGTAFPGCQDLGEHLPQGLAARQPFLPASQGNSCLSIARLSAYILMEFPATGSPSSLVHFYSYLFLLFPSHLPVTILLPYPTLVSSNFLLWFSLLFSFLLFPLFSSTSRSSYFLLRPPGPRCIRWELRRRKGFLLSREALAEPSLQALETGFAVEKSRSPCSMEYFRIEFYSQRYVHLLNSIRFPWRGKKATPYHKGEKPSPEHHRDSWT